MAPNLSHHIISEALFLLLVFQALFVKSESQFSESLKQYLEAFGYYSINGSSLTDAFDDSLESALKAYQQHYRLEATGRVDSETVKIMSIPRCGVRDVFDNSNDGVKFSMVANYSLFEGMPRWDKRRLTYKFRSSAHVISVRRLRPIIARALQKWAVVSNFTFREEGFFGRSDIVLGFHRHAHGDNFPFDGPGNVLAHAFAPQVGMLHFDADENWSSNNLTRSNQIDLESVSIHELGHTLGLGHSRDPDAIMYAYYRPGSIKRDLGQDDIDGIRALYSN
ncbi:hypothetical protein V6N13_086753 [Hibiscus sabdariffa]|uniref:Peptidase metallopeptidase domain-containing protein n=1 Tax=Hibiscus sabdariffa TaxID=183260 RepID=A0ABR2FU37_9ROSI